MMDDTSYPLKPRTVHLAYLAGISADLDHLVQRYVLGKALPKQSPADGDGIMSVFADGTADIFVSQENDSGLWVGCWVNDRPDLDVFSVLPLNLVWEKVAHEIAAGLECPTVYVDAEALEWLAETKWKRKTATLHQFLSAFFSRFGWVIPAPAPTVVTWLQHWYTRADPERGMNDNGAWWRLAGTVRATWLVEGQLAAVGRPDLLVLRPRGQFAEDIVCDYMALTNTLRDRRSFVDVSLDFQCVLVVAIDEHRCEVWFNHFEGEHPSTQAIRTRWPEAIPLWSPEVDFLIDGQGYPRYVAPASACYAAGMTWSEIAAELHRQGLISTPKSQKLESWVSRKRENDPIIASLFPLRDQVGSQQVRRALQRLRETSITAPEDIRQATSK
ncbi:MAG: hypothetical protein IRY86_09810 [Thermorudis peleae]|nr:hypothetical protein [Thermorudis peleae]